MQTKALKEKLAVLLSKTENDDRLIAALRAEIMEIKRSQGKEGRPGCVR